MVLTATAANCTMNRSTNAIEYILSLFELRVLTNTILLTIIPGYSKKSRVYIETVFPNTIENILLIRIKVA